MNNMNPRTIEAISQDGILARNKVLRQTYILLGMNVLFSALCAYAGMLMNIGRINPLIAIVALVGLSIAIRANRTNGLGIVLLFALTGFLGLYVANVLNQFVAHMSGLSLAISAACLILFSGYVLYDTSNIIQGEETNYIMATLQLFLDIFNIFISLLNLLSAFNRN